MSFRLRTDPERSPAETVLAEMLIGEFDALAIPQRSCATDHRVVKDHDTGVTV